MAYILEFRDERHLEDVMEKLAKAKKAVMEACEAIEEADGNSGQMNERGGMYRDLYPDEMHYRRGGRYRNGGSYRDGGRYGY